MIGDPEDDLDVEDTKLEEEEEDDGKVTPPAEEEPEPEEEEEPEPEPEEEEEPEPEEEEELPPEPKKVTRSEKRFQSLANKNRELEDARRRDADELARLRQQQVRQADQARQQQEYRDWYGQLTPEQQWYEDQRQQNIALTHKINRIEFNTLDREDKANFTRTLAQNPKWAVYEDEVERLLVEVRSTGVNATRDLILTQVIGQKVRQMKTPPVQKKAAQTRVKGQTVKSSKPGGDVGRSSRKPAADSLEALESRLKGRSF